MVRRMDFELGDDLVLLLPIDRVDGERVELERWPFDDVVLELERCAELASQGDRRAMRIYQRLVYSLRGARRARQASEAERGESSVA